MNEIIKLYEEYEERLVIQRKDLMSRISDLSKMEMEDKEIMDLVNEMMGMSSYIGSCISILGNKIKRLKEALERA